MEVRGALQNKFCASLYSVQISCRPCIVRLDSLQTSQASRRHIVSLKSIEYSFGYIIIRSPYTPYSLFSGLLCVVLADFLDATSHRPCYRSCLQVPQPWDPQNPVSEFLALVYHNIPESTRIHDKANDDQIIVYHGKKQDIPTWALKPINSTYHRGKLPVGSNRVVVPSKEAYL